MNRSIRLFGCLILTSFFLLPSYAHAARELIPSLTTAWPNNRFSCMEGVCSGFRIEFRGNVTHVYVSGPGVFEVSSLNIPQQTHVNYHLNGNALIRVVGTTASKIDGRVTVAGGKLFLVNSNGVILNTSFNIETSGLVVSSLDIRNSDFLAGRYSFFQANNAAYVVNKGNIHISNLGYVALVSSAVVNSGSVLAPLGNALLASGSDVTLLDNAGNLSVRVDGWVKNSVMGPDGKRMVNAIQSSGTIMADGGKIVIAAKSLDHVFDEALNHTGTIQATTLMDKSGSLEIDVDRGEVVISGPLNADSITVTSGAMVVGGGIPGFEFPDPNQGIDPFNQGGIKLQIWKEPNILIQGPAIPIVQNGPIILLKEGERDRKKQPL
jgi:filamentous hemagglutinin family protein